MKRVFTTMVLLGSTVGLAGCMGGVSSNAPSAAATMAVAGTSASSGSTNTQYTAQVVDSGTYQDTPRKDASFADLINGVRTANGVGTVEYNARLDKAAQGHADDMLDQDYFSHTSLDGRTLSDRVNATGYQWKKVGENIGQGQTSEQEVLDGWVASAGHQANNIDPDFEEFGLGRAGTGKDTRWVLVFGDPSD